MDKDGFIVVGRKSTQNGRKIQKNGNNGDNKSNGTNRTNVNFHNTNNIKVSVEYDNRPITKKRILCQGMINTGICSYGNKCTFAHNLGEQNVDPIRKLAYSILDSSDDLSHINLAENEPLFDAFVALSRLCFNCVENKCLGGYNCSRGAINNEHVICYKDLIFGNCSFDRNMISSTRSYCPKIHLTHRGLICKNRIGYEPMISIKPEILIGDFSRVKKDDSHSDSISVGSITSSLDEVESDKCSECSEYSECVIVLK